MDIVIVDDDPIALELLKRNLRQSACRAQSFSDGQEALAYLASGFADLLIVDYRMPGLDGLEILSRLAQGSGIRATETWLCSAADFPEDVQVTADVLGVRLISKDLFRCRAAFLTEIFGNEHQSPL